VHWQANVPIHQVKVLLVVRTMGQTDCTSSTQRRKTELETRGWNRLDSTVQTCKNDAATQRHQAPFATPHEQEK
jgi:hypothetical protein